MRSNFFLSISLLALSLGIGSFPGCGRTREQDLELRVSNLERNLESMQKRYSEREAKLEDCVANDAENAYWEVLQSRGKLESPGVYRAPRSVWREARKKRDRKIQECKLLWAQ
jgi:hypothetical protein